VNLFPDHFPRGVTIAAVAVVALVAAIMVSRGVSGGPASPSPAVETQKPHPQPQPKAKTKQGAGADHAATPSKPRRSGRSYVSCIQGAEDVQALERCQALLP
jgi:hypothetical protein